MSSIADSIREITKNPQEVYAVMAIASEVDEVKRTCTIDPLDGRASVFDVPLQGVSIEGGWVLIPEDGSKVLAVFTSIKSASIVATTKVEKAFLYSSSVELGGKDGQPLVLGDDLNSKLVELIGKVNDLTDKLALFANAQATASVGVLAPLIPGFTQLVFDTNIVKAGLAQVEQTLDAHLSQSVKTV